MAGLVSRSARLVMVGVVGLCASAMLASAATQDSFQPVGKMSQPREEMQTTLLTDGTVLVTGGNYYKGDDGVPLAGAELFDPRTNQFTAVSAMAAPRDDSHRAVRLQDGCVLVLGGSPDFKKHHRSAEVFDPATRAFSPVSDMKQDRAAPTATLLPDGKVLVAGGWARPPRVPRLPPSCSILGPARFRRPAGWRRRAIGTVLCLFPTVGFLSSAAIAPGMIGN
jgi:hypothetical protein